MWQLCADHLKTSLHEAGLSGGRCRLVCGLLAYVESQEIFPRLSYMLCIPFLPSEHPVLGSYGVYPDIPCLSCLHLNSQLLVCSLLRAGLQGELEHPLPSPDCFVATGAPWSLFLSLFFLVFKENLQSFLSSCSNNQGFQYMPGASL